MKVEFRISFTQDLKAARNKNLSTQVKKLIEVVERANTLAEVPNLKKLKGRGDHYRVRLGDYRVGMALVGNTLIFVRCLNRKEIYRYFPL